MKKKLLAILLVGAMLLSALSFIGCANGGNGATEPAGDNGAAADDNGAVADDNGDAPAVDGDRQTVLVWTWFSEQLGPSVGAAFEEAFPQFYVEAVTIPSGDLETRLLTGITAQSGLPDTNSLQGDSIQRFIQFGGLMDLTDIIAPHVDNFPAYKIANNSDADGRIFGFPIDAGPSALFFCTVLAEEAGIDPAVDFATYESWLAAGAKYAEIGVALHRMLETGDAGWTFMLTQQQGQSVFDEDGNAMLNTPEFINAVTLVLDLWNSGFAGEWEEWGPHYPDAVVGGEVGTIIAAAWYMNVFIHSFSDARDWAIVPMPTFPGSTSRTSNAGGSEMVIPIDSDNPEGGIEFARFYTANVEGRLIGMEALGEFPAYLPIYDVDEVRTRTLPFFGDQYVFSFFAELLPEVPSWRTPSPLIAVRDMVGAEYHLVLSGAMTPAQFAEHVQEMAEAIVRDFE